MKTLILIAITATALTASTYAQVSGVYKISKESPDTLMERIEFRTDGTADVLQVIDIPKHEDGRTSFDHATKEVRVNFKSTTDEKLDDYIDRLKAHPNLQDITEKLLKFRTSGYNTLVVFELQHGSTPVLMMLVGKGDELVDLKKGFIFKRGAWF